MNRPDDPRPADEKGKEGEKSSESRQIMRGLSMVGNLSFGMAACVFVGFFLGRWLDKLLGTSPVLLIVFIILGVAASYKMLFDAAKKG